MCRHAHDVRYRRWHWWYGLSTSAGACEKKYLTRHGKLIFSSDCFMKFLTTKVLKRLETNKLRGGYKGPQKTLLLPVSFGVSSISLLQVLDQHLRNRTDQGRHAGYALHILFVDQSVALEQGPLHTLLSSLGGRYPTHKYTAIPLEDCFDYGIDMDYLVAHNTSVVGRTVVDKTDCLRRTLSSLPSATSRLDIVEILRRRLIMAFARRHACDSILFGDSTTRLAEKTFSETAKGRGIALPWLTADGSSSEGIRCTYPLRDVLKKELSAYASLVSPPLLPLIFDPPTKISISSHNTTIDGLMSQYFESVEQNYPSIVANVVRTSGRLVAPLISDESKKCSACANPIMNGSWGGEQQSTTISGSAENNGCEVRRILCYGCTRTLIKP